MKKLFLLVVGMLALSGSVYAAGDLIVNGKIGVGTTTPGAPVHINAETGDNPRLLIEGSLRGNMELKTTASGGYCVLKLNNPTYDWSIQTYDGTGALAINSILEHGEDSYTKLLIQNNGNVGIGTRTPSQKLYVAGNIYATGSITPGCSRTLKENITDLSLTEAINTLKGLNPVTFNYKAEKVKDLHLGFIAEDVPELVATPDRKGVDPMDIVAIVTKVVQEQQKMIQQQNERIMKLEAELSGKR